MFDSVELSIAMDGLRKDCYLKRRYVGSIKGKIYVRYDIVKKTFLGKRKIGQIDIFNGKVLLNGLTESLYGFQKDELIEKAAADFLILFGKE